MAWSHHTGSPELSTDVTPFLLPGYSWEKKTNRRCLSLSSRRAAVALTSLATVAFLFAAALWATYGDESVSLWDVSNETVSELWKWDVDVQAFNTYTTLGHMSASTQTPRPLALVWTSQPSKATGAAAILSTAAARESAAPVSSRVPLSLLPDPERRPRGGPTEKFLGYYPHWGFHNQRIELVNAIMLAHLLNRTLLIGPAWLGWPTSSYSYPKISSQWEEVMVKKADSFRPHRSKAKRALTVDECKSYSRACKSTYNDTFAAWSFLTDVRSIEDVVPLVDRFNMTEAFAMEITGSSPKDVYKLVDQAKYEFQFVEDDPSQTVVFENTTSESKYLKRVSLPLWRREIDPYKLVLLGSMYGSDKIAYRSDTGQKELLNRVERSMAFRHPLLERASNEIADLLGRGKYLGVHARVGDGNFTKNPAEAMRSSFENLMGKMGVDPSVLPELVEAANKRNKDELHKPRRVRDPSGSKEVEQSRRPARSPLPEIKSREDSSLDRSMICRRRLHKDEKKLLLNTPLYIATDSAHPLRDPALSIFFANFPCAFVLSDFNRPNSFNPKAPLRTASEMESSFNVNDGVEMGRLLIPFMEAAVAAKARLIVGTSGSTFSAFAETSLAEAYRLDGLS